MIQSDEELAVVQTQLNRIELALASLRRDMLPANPERYHLWAENYVDTIHQLRAEIDAYLGLAIAIAELGH